MYDRLSGADRGTNERMRDELNVVLERLNRSSEQFSDVKRQVAITGKVIDLYWQLELKNITAEDCQKRLICMLQEW